MGSDTKKKGFAEWFSEGFEAAMREEQAEYEAMAPVHAPGEGLVEVVEPNGEKHFDVDSVPYVDPVDPVDEAVRLRVNGEISSACWEHLQPILDRLREALPGEEKEQIRKELRRKLDFVIKNWRLC